MAPGTHALIGWWTAHVLPLLGRIRVRALARADVERFARDVAAGKTAREEAGGKRGPRVVRGGERNVP